MDSVEILRQKIGGAADLEMPIHVTSANLLVPGLSVTSLQSLSRTTSHDRLVPIHVASYSIEAIRGQPFVVVLYVHEHLYRSKRYTCSEPPQSAQLSAGIADMHSSAVKFSGKRGNRTVGANY
jgi:hypothetical protein